MVVAHVLPVVGLDDLPMTEDQVWREAGKEGVSGGREDVRSGLE